MSSTLEQDSEAELVEVSAPISQIDGDREARIAQRKVRMEQARLAKLKPQLNTAGISFNAEQTLRRVKKPEVTSKGIGKSTAQISLSEKRITVTEVISFELDTS
jgi:hypothetical protein